LAIAPGATINLAFYHLLPNTLVADATGMENLIASMSEFSTFDSRLTAGLPGGTVVANWAAVPESLEEPPADPELAATGRELAATGVDATTPVLGALALLLMGLAARGVVRRRAAGRS
jgi:LPXTG-motif cell wall-anchored protein